MADLTAAPNRSSDTPTTPKKKPLPFKRHTSRLGSGHPTTGPAAKKDDNDSDDDLSLFRRSKQLLPKALQERDEEFKIKKEKRKSEDAQKAGRDEKASRRPVDGTASSFLDDDEDAYGVSDRELERRAKKRKTEGMPDGLLSSPRPEAANHSPTNDPVTPPTSRSSHSVGDSAPASIASRKLAKAVDRGVEPTVPYSLTPPTLPKPQSTPLSADSRPIELDSTPALPDKHVATNDKTFASTSQAVDPNAPITIDDEDDDLMETEDPEFAKYIIRAQARSEKAKLAREMARAAVRSDASGAERISTINDPIITITLKSRLETPNKITPIQARIKMSQTMKPLRHNFINHARNNGLKISEDEADSIFLTWRGIKIYDTTTGLSLNVTPDAEGNIRDEHGHRLNDESKGYHKGGLFFEAWTDRVFEQFQRSKNMARLRSFDGILDDDEESGQDMDELGGQGPVQESAPLITITLKSRNSEPQEVQLGADATIAQLVAAFRNKQGLGSDQAVALYFDGLRLDEAASVGETELEDGDEVDVHLS